MTDADKAKNLMVRIKGDIREVINKYATESSELRITNDPHASVLAFAQTALANAAVDYMVLCGATPTEAFQISANVTGVAMKHWVETIIRMHGLQAKTTTDTVEVTDEKISIN